MNPAVQPNTVATRLTEYLDHLTALGRSKATTDAYRHRLGPLLQYADEHTLDVDAFTRRDIEAVGNRVTTLLIAPSSQASHTMAIRGFLKWCGRQGHCPAELGAAMEVPRVSKGLPPKPLTPRQLRRIQDTLPTRSTATPRNRALLGVMWACGLRRGEVIRLNVSDLDPDARRLRVNGKGNVGRMMPISQRAVTDVIDYLDVRRQAGHLLPPCS